MHPVLEIQEILLNIFSHCYDPPEEPRDASWLAALARTCHAFKDPALDVLWEKLYSFSPLFRCLPGAFREKEGKHLFIRPLTETEWDILRSYTRRIRSLEDFSTTSEVKTFLNPPTNDPLFPRLRSLCCKYEMVTILLSQLPIPSLNSLDLHVDTRDNVQSLPTLFPNISSLSIALDKWEIGLSCGIGPDYFSRWKNLDTLICDRVHLDINSIVHLSRVPTLTRLSLFFTLLNKLPASHPILRFENLQELSMHCDCSPALSSLLSRTEFLSITSFSLVIYEFEETLGSFFSLVQTANPTHTIETLSLSTTNETGPMITFHALQPCMAFHHLRSLRINTVAQVQLAENDLLTLASAWPLLQKLSLNRSWGWFTADGITPSGLLQLLHTCQDLSDLTLPIDTRGEIPKLPEDFGSTLPDAFTINVLDSKIGVEVVPAMRGFFAGFASGCNFSLIAWHSRRMLHDDDESEMYTKRWNDVYPLDKAADVDVN